MYWAWATALMYKDMKPFQSKRTSAFLFSAIKYTYRELRPLHIHGSGLIFQRGKRGKRVHCLSSFHLNSSHPLKAHLFINNLDLQIFGDLRDPFLSKWKLIIITSFWFSRKTDLLSLLRQWKLRENVSDYFCTMLKRWRWERAGKDELLIFEGNLVRNELVWIKIWEVCIKLDLIYLLCPFLFLPFLREWMKRKGW